MGFRDTLRKLFTKTNTKNTYSTAAPGPDSAKRAIDVSGGIPDEAGRESELSVGGDSERHRCRLESNMPIIHVYDLKNGKWVEKFSGEWNSVAIDRIRYNNPKGSKKNIITLTMSQLAVNDSIHMKMELPHAHPVIGKLESAYESSRGINISFDGKKVDCCFDSYTCTVNKSFLSKMEPIMEPITGALGQIPVQEDLVPMSGAQDHLSASQVGFAPERIYKKLSTSAIER